MASQVANLPAGFGNNIGPNMIPVQQLQPQVYLPQNSVVQELPITNEVVDTISIFGQIFQRKYFYLFLVLILGVVGYFLWKWWNGKNKKDDDSDDETDEEDENNNDDDEQALMQQMMMQEMIKQQMNKEN